MINEHNRSPISMRQGRVFWNGDEISDAVTCTINFTPETVEVRQLGDYGTSIKYLGHNVTGTITRWRATDDILKLIMHYLDTGITPEFDITGRIDDKGSDYHGDYGETTITALGCVFTGDLPLISMDAKGEVVTDELSFHAVSIAKQ